MKVLVTGGTGYIGSHTVVELQMCGVDVIIVDNLSNSKIEVIDGIEKITGKRPVFEKTDLVDLSETIKIFEKYKDISAVIHFAALKAVEESVKNPLAYYFNNLNSLINVLFCMEKYNVNNIVFSSSCTVYGQAELMPVTENTVRKKAESPYGNTKAVCEDILCDVCKANKKLKAIALRYFNPIGAHPSSNIGELPNGSPNNLVPFLTQTVAGLREKLFVFGDDYNTPDGTAIRDYVDIVDLAKAHVAAIKRLINESNKNNFELFNVGTGHGISVLDIIKVFEKATGQKVNYEIIGRREGDIEMVWADTSYANKELGWKAETSLEETLVNAWNFQIKCMKSTYKIC
jgi:UDP-glucose 4-epimerase